MSLRFLSFYYQAYSAVTDFSFYQSIFEQPLRRTVFYLIGLTAHVAALFTLIAAWHYGPEFLEISRWAQQNFPPLEVQEGRLKVGSEQPLVKKYPGRQAVTFVFDTTGVYTEPEQLEEPAVLFTEEKLFFRYLGQTQTYLWKNLPFQRLEQVTQLIKWTYFPFAYSSIFVYALCAKALLALLLISIGLLASEPYGIRLGLPQYFTITLYSLTPAVTIGLAVTLTGLGVGYFTFFCVGTAGIYSYLATQKCVAVEP
ncbi:DUF1189 domain-containing protein [Acidobacteria bacterium AH-259-D05]|nr:DUF1189 domain-containing protein [Acidobacteria bacterium AH-259-D05]